MVVRHAHCSAMSRFAFATVNRALLIDAIAMLSIGLVGVIGYKLSPLLVPRADVLIAPDAGCNLHRGACTAIVDGSALEIRISPRPIPAVKPISLEVHAPNHAIRRIDADFAGIGMNMGMHRPQLLAQGQGIYQTETTLPVCITGSMEWALTLLVETTSGQVLIPIRFTTPAKEGDA